MLCFHEVHEPHIPLALGEGTRTAIGRTQVIEDGTLEVEDLSQVFLSGTFRYAPFLTMRRRSGGMIDFKGSHFEKEIILWGVRWYVAYPISYRQLEEMMGEGIVNLRLTKCEMIQYRVCKKIMTAICCSHVRL
jgi:hypothetical protein